MKSFQSLIKNFHIVSLLAICTMPVKSFAQESQRFSIIYDAVVTIDSERAANTGLSQSAINTIWGAMGGSVSVGNIEDTVSFSKGAYSIQSIGTPNTALSFFIKGSFARLSEGNIEKGTLSTVRYTDTRLNNPQLTTFVKKERKIISFYDGMTLKHRAPYREKMHDVLSLPYIFIGKLPAKPVTVEFSDGKSIKQAVFDVQKTSLELSSGKWETVKLTKRISSKEDAAVEFWLRATDGMPLRIRIGMGQRYGAVLDMKALNMPAKVQPY